MTNLTLFNDFDLLNHVDFCITPVPVVKSLFDKAVFYNLCLQKLFVYAANDKKTLIELTETFFPNNMLIQALLKIAKNEFKILRRFKTPFCTINRNDYVSDKDKRFIFLTNTELIPTQLKFSDNEFYAIFSNKYPLYFPISKDAQISSPPENQNENVITGDDQNIENKGLTSNVQTITNQTYFYNSNSSVTRTTTIENICSCIISIMKAFIEEYNEYLSITNKESFLPKDRFEEERKENERLVKLEEERLQKEKEKEKEKENSGGEQVVVEPLAKEANTEEKKQEDQKQPEKEKVKDEKDPNFQPIVYNESMVVFICKEKNENNRIEQLFLINELYSKQ